MTADQLLAIFTAAFKTDERIEQAIHGLAFQWDALAATAGATAARGAAQVMSQAAEQEAQAADQAAQKAQAAFVAYVASLQG